MTTRVDNAARHDHEPEYRAIFEASSDGMVINDLETGIVLEANPAFCRMHGYDTMTGLHPTAFIHPESQHLFVTYVEAIRGGGEFRCRAQDVRRDGTTFDVEVLGRRFTYQSKFAMLGVVRDVTEQVRSYQALERRVMERTREIERRREVAEALGELLTVVNSRHTLDEILDYVVVQASRLLGSHASAIYVPTRERGEDILSVAASNSLDAEYVAVRIPVGMPATGLAFASCRPVAVYDIPAALSADDQTHQLAQLEDRTSHLRVLHLWGPWSERKPFDNERVQRLGAFAVGFRAILSVPLAAREENYGALTLYYREARDFTDDEVRLATAFAGQAGLAIENATLHTRAEQRLREQEALYRADEALHRSLHLDDVLQALCDLAAELFGAEKTAVWTWDEQRQSIVVSAAHGISAEFRGLCFPPDAPATDTLISDEVVVVEDLRTAHNLNPDFRSAVDREGVRAYLSATIRVADQIFGSFAVGYGEPRTFADREHRLLLALAQRAGLAIENARLYQQSERRGREMELLATDNARLHQEAARRLQEIEALYGADEQIYRSLRLDEVLQALVDVASDLFQPDKVSLGIVDQETGRVVVGAARGFAQRTLAEALTPEEGRQLRKYLVGGVVVMNDAQRDSRLPPSIAEANRREGIRSSMAAPIRIGSDVVGGFGLSYCQFRTFSEEEQRLLAALAQRAAMAIQNARLHEESERRRQELEALYQADEALHRSLRLQDVLEALVDAAMDLLHADGVGLWGPPPDDTSKTLPLATRGISQDYLNDTMALNQDQDLNKLWFAHESFASADAPCDPHFPAAQRAALEREGFRGLLSTQVRVADQVFGSFTVGFRTVHTFTSTEKRLLATLAQRAGLAIQNARLYEQAQRAATLEERQRLARELHDAVTQTLFSTALIADVIPHLWDVEPAQGRRGLEELRRLTRGALAEMRTLLVELRPGALTELPLQDLLRQLGEAAGGRTRLEVSVQTDRHDLSHTPAEVRVALYRIAQEAMNNIVKHAQAQHASICLDRQADDGISLRIEDDGRGYDVTAIPAGHFGVGIMRERAQAIGAALSVDSTLGTGTRIELSWQGYDEKST